MHCDNADYNLAIRTTRRRLGGIPSRPRIACSGLEVRFVSRDYEGTIEDCTEATRLDPGFSAAYGLLGAAWLKRRDADRALTSWTKRSA